MAIKFICSCGKHLRARDEMAMRRSVCPQCGNPVGIPSKEPHGAGVMTPQERRRLARLRGEEADTDLDARKPVPLDPAEVQPPAKSKGRRPRPRRPMESRWYHCLLYPFQCLPVVGGLALGLTLLTACLLAVVPAVSGKTTDLVPPPDAQPLVVGWAYGMALLLVGVFVCGHLQGTMDSATTGETVVTQLPFGGGKRPLRSTVLWSLSFLAGPVVFVAAAVLYGVQIGVETLLDRVILAEFCIAALASWLLTVVASSRRGRLLDANPVRVIGLVRDFGVRMPVTAGLAAAAAAAHGVGVYLALESMHRDEVPSVLGLAACWFSLMFWGTFVFRLLGMWLHHGPPSVEAPEVLPEPGSRGVAD